jgi:hypothetical protein
MNLVSFLDSDNHHTDGTPEKPIQAGPGKGLIYFPYAKIKINSEIFLILIICESDKC